MRLGRRMWAIADGYIPAESKHAERALASHETASILNVADRSAQIRLTVFLADREPAGPYRVAVGARRTLHLRFNDLSDPEPIPRGTDYSCLIESDLPVVVRHTRLDSRDPALALLSSVPFSQD